MAVAPWPGPTSVVDPRRAQMTIPSVSQAATVPFMKSKEDQLTVDQAQVRIVVFLSPEDHHKAKIAATETHESVPRWIAGLVNTALIP